MNKHINILSFGKVWVGCLLLTLVLVSCGTDNKHFRLEGRLLNLRQGEFTVYSPDGAMATADTLKVVGGRFDFTGECLGEGTVVIVMPNGAEVPVFVEPGASLSMKGDAQDLDQVEVTGTKANDVMNEFRKASAGKTDKEISSVLLDIVGKYPEEITGLYLIRHYLLSTANYDNAYKAVTTMLAEQKDNSQLSALSSQLKEMISAEKGKGIPAFSVKAIDGQTISAAMLRKGLAVVACWASWDFESTNILKRILEIRSSDGRSPFVLAISFDADPSKVKSTLESYAQTSSYWEREGLRFFCDGNMVDGHLAHLFSFSQVPTVIIIKDGKIIERDFTGDNAVNKIKELCL